MEEDVVVVVGSAHLTAVAGSGSGHLTAVAFFVAVGQHFVVAVVVAVGQHQAVVEPAVEQPVGSAVVVAVVAPFVAPLVVVDHAVLAAVAGSAVPGHAVAADPETTVVLVAVDLVVAVVVVVTAHFYCHLTFSFSVYDSAAELLHLLVPGTLPPHADLDLALFSFSFQQFLLL